MMQIPVKASLSISAGFTAMALSFSGCAARNPHDTAGIFRFLVTQRGCVAGKLTDSITGRSISGAVLKIVPAIPGARVSTDQNGFYYAELPGGKYTLSFAKPGYRPAEKSVALKPGDTAGWDAKLEPTSPVIVNAGYTVTGAAPGSTVALKAQVIIRDGSALKEIHWDAHRDDGDVTARVSDGKGREVMVTLPGISAYKASLLYHLGKDGRILERWGVMGIVPADLREAGKVTMTATATTSSGTYTDSVDIVADLDTFAVVNPGLQNVAIGKPLFLQGKFRDAYAWSLVAPSGSGAVMKDAATRNPRFTPDIPGIYKIREGNETRLTISAGLWHGAVVAKESEPRERWVGLKGCYCHSSGGISSKFVAWRDSGHSEIFTKCVNTVFRYDEKCTRCHSVGFSGKSDDGGITSAPDYPAFRRDSTLWDLGKEPPRIIPKPGNFDYIFDNYPDVARLANVQCENCHGPNNSDVLRVGHLDLRRSLDHDFAGAVAPAQVEVQRARSAPIQEIFPHQVQAFLAAYLVPEPHVHGLRCTLGSAPVSTMSSTFTFGSPLVVSIFPRMPTTLSLAINSRLASYISEKKISSIDPR